MLGGWDAFRRGVFLSTFSGAQRPERVEVARDADVVHIRESDEPGVILTVTPAHLAAFMANVKAGDVDHLVGPTSYP